MTPMTTLAMAPCRASVPMILLPIHPASAPMMIQPRYPIFGFMSFSSRRREHDAAPTGTGLREETAKRAAGERPGIAGSCCPPEVVTSTPQHGPHSGALNMRNDERHGSNKPRIVDSPPGRSFGHHGFP